MKITNSFYFSNSSNLPTVFNLKVCALAGIPAWERQRRRCSKLLMNSTSALSWMSEKESCWILSVFRLDQAAGCLFQSETFKPFPIHSSQLEWGSKLKFKLKANQNAIQCIRLESFSALEVAPVEIRADWVALISLLAKLNLDARSVVQRDL